jgi:hypothetical protein
MGTMWVFQKWSDGVTGIERMYTTPGASSTIEPLFNEYFRLNLLPEPNGRLTASPFGQAGYYRAGTPVTITATPNPGYRFWTFTGSIQQKTDPLVTNMSAPFSIGAVFIPIQ